MNHCVRLHLLMLSINHSVLYDMAQVRKITEQSVCLVQLYFKCESARKFQCKFPEEPIPSRQIIQNLVNNLKTKGSLPDKKPDRKRTVLTEETLDNIGARLDTSPRKSLE
jgi:hypothetical protein